MKSVQFTKRYPKVLSKNSIGSSNDLSSEKENPPFPSDCFRPPSEENRQNYLRFKEEENSPKDKVKRSQTVSFSGEVVVNHPFKKKNKPACSNSKPSPKEEEPNQEYFIMDTRKTDELKTVTKAKKSANVDAHFNSPISIRQKPTESEKTESGRKLMSQSRKTLQQPS
jgi:hypothetical protein